MSLSVGNSSLVCSLADPRVYFLPSLLVFYSFPGNDASTLSNCLSNLAQALDAR